MTLGEYLKGLRKAMRPRHSLEYMAERIDCSKSYLWDVESDNVMPTLRMSVKIAKAYKTTVSKMAKQQLEWSPNDRTVGPDAALSRQVPHE